jgi:hypothetical protein
MNTRVITTLLMLLSVLLLPSSLAAQNPNNVNTWIRQSTFIFVGTVEALNATTMNAVAANQGLAVVRVDKVISAPGAPPDLAGKNVTVKLLPTAELRRGQEATFYTKGWLLGNSLAVIEVGHSVPAEAATQEQVDAVHQQMADEDLQREMASAVAVVTGVVRSVQKSKAPHIGSEHDPDWYQAEIVVRETLKGKLRGEIITVLFPHSDDVMWHNSPKFHEGQQGIWLLHVNQVRLPGVQEQYTALRPLDFQSEEQRDRIQRLLSNKQ